MINKPRIVLDTNVFLVSLAPQYKYHWIYEYVIQGKFELCLTTEILLEYEEIVCARYGLERIDGMFNYLLLIDFPKINLLKYEEFEMLFKDKL